MSRLTRRHFLQLGALSALASRCGGLEKVTSLLAAPTPLPAPPDPRSRVAGYLRAWELADYPAMHAVLSTPSRSAMDLESFAGRHRAIAQEAGLDGLEARPTFALAEEEQATVGVALSFSSNLLGEIPVRNRYPLVLEDGQWRIEWSPALIFPQLQGERLVHLVSDGHLRGDIYDRGGLPLATRGTQVTVGVVPVRIEDEDALLAALSPIVGLSGAEIVARYRKPGSQPEWFMPVADLPSETAQLHWETLQGLAGVELREKYTRLYPNGPVAGHVVGYVGPITREEFEVLAAEGYQVDDLLGKAGLERWGEHYLAGRRSATLAVVEPGGGIAEVIKRRPGIPSRSLYTSLYLTLQKAAEKALEGQRGAVVALDPRSGEIIALASSPGFDPNELAQGLTVAEWQALLGDPARPLVTRATLGAQPTGSLFKIVTAAAALEAGVFTPDTTITCTGSWHAVGRTWGDNRAHGPVDMRRALTVSCNVYFYQAGFHLYSLDPEILPRFARDFGLGRATGLRELPEAEGLVPANEFAGDAINLAIGQGAFLATPLQVARLVAAVANGGTLYRPRLARAASGAPGLPDTLFPAEAVARLPVSSSTLAVIREGLDAVTSGRGGTAAHIFRGAGFTSAGKTGTAQNPAKPHAWFTGWAPYEDPQLAMAVIVEEAGEGSAVAAPIFRKLVEVYFGLPSEEEPSSESSGG